MVFLSQKVDGNMIFTDYWKVLVLTFLEMGNTVFSWAKKLTEIWYLLVTGKILFWTFRWWEIRSFLSQEVAGKVIFTSYWEVLVLNFSMMGKTVFFSAKKLTERWYLRGLFELSMIFQDLGNMVFRAVYTYFSDDHLLISMSMYNFICLCKILHHVKEYSARLVNFRYIVIYIFYPL